MLAVPLVLAVLHSSVSESAQTSTLSAASAPLRLCGSALVNTLELVCETYNKRSSPLDFDSNALADDEEPVGVFRTRRSALRLVPRSFTRHRRGVVDECCHNSCTIEELATYCKVSRI
ncbi:insulin-like [Macrosteles quadrilineatus]|uniref:insulin-like n=1 Tax=Macrosteles quadrilineatus TaxID=74068 RepID=UPI0023E2DEE1|nr:insulin-like [Macrosteles quadrilineatus]